MFDALTSLPPELCWGLFIRGLGLTFLISFLSLSSQIVRGAGRGGGLPIATRLAKIKDDFPTWRRFYYFPTLLWLSDRDFMLRLLTLGGLIASALVIYGGEHSFWALLICYICYLSLDMAIGLIFPWDCLLFEATVLALFLPSTHALPELTAASAPAPALSWAYRLLLFRLMFGFGKQKFLGSSSKDLAYLKGFLIAQPLPSPLGWYASKLPAPCLKLLVLAMFLSEIPLPFFGFVPGIPSLLFAFSTAGLMLGIQVMGSFGYFSLATIVCCLPLLDNVTPTQLRLGELFSVGAPIFTNAFVLIHTLMACLAFVFNSWVGQSWHLWSAWYRLPPIAQFPFDFLRLLHPFRGLHPYGVFPPNTSPGVKISLLVEVSWDMQKWHEVEFEYSPSNARSAPKFVAPHHPRGDQAVIYETFGLNPTSLISSMMGPWDPHSYGSQPAANVLIQRILEGHGLDFMKGTVLKDHKEPPQCARINVVMLEPASLEAHREQGVWWKRSYIGPHAPPRQLDPKFWQNLLPEPEMWHFDAICWRRRSKLGRLMRRSLIADQDPMQLVLEGAPELTDADVGRFWNELVPLVGSTQRQSFDTLPEVVAQVRSRFDRDEQRTLHRLLGRFSALLIARLEPLYLGKGWKTPPIPVKTYFHLWMLVHHVIGNGREAYLAAMNDPRSVAALSPEMTVQTGLYYLSIFRYESMIFEAQKLRLITAISPPHDEAEKRAVSHSSESMTGFEKTVANLAETFSGFFGVMPTLRDNFHGPRFYGDYPELYPSFAQLESGEVVVRSHAKRPEGAALPGDPVQS